MARRKWYSGIGIVVRTSWKSLGAFKKHGLALFIPLVLFLFLIGILTYIASSFTPLAPFIYSLI